LLDEPNELREVPYQYRHRFPTIEEFMIHEPEAYFQELDDADAADTAAGYR